MWFLKVRTSTRQAGTGRARMSARHFESARWASRVEALATFLAAFERLADLQTASAEASVVEAAEKENAQAAGRAADAARFTSPLSVRLPFRQGTVVYNLVENWRVAFDPLSGFDAADVVNTVAAGMAYCEHEQSTPGGWRTHRLAHWRPGSRSPAVPWSFWGSTRPRHEPCGPVACGRACPRSSALLSRHQSARWSRRCGRPPSHPDSHMQATTGEWRRHCPGVPSTATTVSYSP